MIISKISQTIFPFMFLLIIWECAVRFTGVDGWILPPPSLVLHSIVRDAPLLISHLLPTLAETLAGLSFSVIFGVIIGIAMYIYPPARKFIYPLLIGSQSVPYLTLAPLLTLWFGFGMLPKIILISVVCFFPIAINLFDGLMSTEKNYLQFMDAAGATLRDKVLHVLFPSSLPNFFSGLRISVSYALLSAVVSEWVGSEKGLGVFLIRSSKSYSTERVFGTILIIAVLSSLFVYSVTVLKKSVIRWKNYA